MSAATTTTAIQTFGKSSSFTSGFLPTPELGEWVSTPAIVWRPSRSGKRSAAMTRTFNVDQLRAKRGSIWPAQAWAAIGESGRKI
jgi:hypothetical protein